MKQVIRRKFLTWLIPIWIILCGISGYLLVSPFTYYITDFAPTNLSGEPNYNNTLYITPIFEQVHPDKYTRDAQELELIKNSLGSSGPYVKIGFSVSCWYSRNIFYNESSSRWDFNSTMLIYKLTLAKNTSTPVLFHMNGGNWGTCGFPNDFLRFLWENDSNCQWDQFNVLPPAEFGGVCIMDRLFSLARVTDFNLYREIHLKQAASIISKWGEDNPDLFVGCSLDSEIHLDYGRDANGNFLFYDYNPLSIQEFREWLAGRYSVQIFNDNFNFNIQTFSQVDAPRQFLEGDLFWEEWTLFRHFQVQQAVSDQSMWLAEAAIPREKIYAHQILATSDRFSDYYGRCDTTETALNEYGVPGYTRYNIIEPSAYREIQKIAGSDWGLFEWNIWSDHEKSVRTYTTQLKAQYLAGIHVLCPNGWWETINPGLMLANNIKFQKAVREFTAIIKDVPRGTSDRIQLTWGDSLSLAYNIQNWDTYYIGISLLWGLSAISPKFVSYLKKKRWLKLETGF